jgi:trans-aconitate 2-methyltransferase
MDWNPQHYLKFKNERTQPSVDLVSRIDSVSPSTIIDIGCGPGNSTQILIERWPKAEVIGIDSSPSMIEKARAAYPHQTWRLGDASKFNEENAYDIVFSNATIQWIPDHETLIANFYHLAKKGGAIALQVPRFNQMPIRSAIAAISENEPWKKYTKEVDALFTYHDPSFYYEQFSRHTARIDLWETTYFHILESQQSIIDFCRSAGMKPFLDSLPTDSDRAQFEHEVLDEVKKRYPLQPDGKVLFPFIRLFVIAYKE